MGTRDSKGLAAGGRRGGRARGRKGIAALTPEARREHQRRAAAARWARARAQSAPTDPDYAARWRGALATVPYLGRELRITLTIDPEGNATLIREYRGVRPQRGRTVTEIPCREQTTRRPDGSPVAPRLEIHPPDGVAHEFHSTIVGPWRENRIVFPGGWSSRQPGDLSLRLESYLPGAYRPFPLPTDDPRGSVGEATGGAPVRVSSPTRKLTIQVRVPDGYPIDWLEPWAWWGDGMEPRAQESVLDRGVCRSWHFARSATRATLEVVDPLPGYVFTVRWWQARGNGASKPAKKKGRKP